MTTYLWYGQLPNALGGYDGNTFDQGGGVVRMEQLWPPIALGLGPSEGLAMGSIAPMITTRHPLHHENIRSLPGSDTMDGDRSTDPPVGVDPAFAINSYLGPERVALWRVTTPTVIERNRIGAGRYWPLGEGPDAFLIQLRAPESVIDAPYPEAYRAWIAEPDGTFLCQPLTADGVPLRACTRYTPGPIGPVAAPTVGAQTSGGAITAGRYWWCYTWVVDGVESLPSLATPGTNALEGVKFALADLVPGPVGSYRNVYRGGVCSSSDAYPESFMERPRFDQMQIVATITDGSATTLVDGVGTSSILTPPTELGGQVGFELYGGPGGQILTRTRDFLAQYFGRRK